MSVVTRAYHVWTGCGWRRVVTSEAVWKATPHFKGFMAVGACAGIGGGLGLGGLIGHLTAPTPERAAAIAIPEPNSLGLMIFALTVLALVVSWRVQA